MDQIDYVAEAKRLLGNTVRRTALVIVPLAIAINNLQAKVTLPTSNVFCQTTGDASFGCFPQSGGASQSGDPGNGILGTSFFTTGPILFYSPSGGISTLILGVNWVGNPEFSIGGLSIDVPSGSTIDFNSTTSSPEPATLGLIGAALAFIGLRKRGGKNKTG